MCSAVDTAGVSGTGSFAIKVVDTPPKLIGLVDLTVSATSPAGAAVSFTVAGMDRLDGPLPVTCSHRSGAVFPIGLTTVSCSTVDSSGATTAGRFAVTVVD